MAENAYEAGSMDISEHRRTWAGFMSLTKYGIVAVAVLLILMAIFLL